MFILITKQNKKFLEERINGKSLKVVEETTNTIVCTISNKMFTRLHNELVTLGYNPYALMTW